MVLSYFHPENLLEYFRGIIIPRKAMKNDCIFVLYTFNDVHPLYYYYYFPRFAHLPAVISYAT